MKKKNDKTAISTGGSALVVEGGGMRGIFSAGVLRAFADESFDPFDLYLGVSAGACNLASHLCGQYDRNFDMIVNYSARREFIDYRRFFTGGHVMDLDWLWDVTMREIRLDLDFFSGQAPRFVAVATSMATGQALYLEPTAETLEDDIKVSSSVPLMFRRILSARGEPASDGGVADSIPAREAFRRGAENVMVIRSRPADYRKRKSRIAAAAGRLFLKEYPAFVSAMACRHVSYNDAVDFLHDPPENCRVVEVNPPVEFRTGRTTTDRDILRRDYERGYHAGIESINDWCRSAEG